jgi:hypothetical protein
LKIHDYSKYVFLTIGFTYVRNVTFLHFQAQRICIANTHLLFNPKRGDIKLAQLQLLFAEIDKIAYFESENNTPNYYPIILTGDMNSEPNCPLYTFMKSGKLHYSGLIACDLSGQKEGRNSTSRVPLPLPLLPEKIGVSEQCQYVDVFKKRNGKSVNDLIYSMDYITVFVHRMLLDLNRVVQRKAREVNEIAVLFKISALLEMA